MEYTEEQIQKMSYARKHNLAINPNTPSDWLAKLATDEYLSIKMAVAVNPSTPESTLWELAKNDFPPGNVRETVAKNVKATPKILLMIWEYKKSNRKLKDVLFAIVRNPNCPDYLKATILTVVPELEGWRVFSK